MGFSNEIQLRVEANGCNKELKDSASEFMRQSLKPQYSYNFSWLGRPIIQYPQDMVAMQELIWRIQPDLIIETGIAHGGSLVYSASLLELNAVCGGDPNAVVVGIDIDIRKNNRKAIEAHPMSKRIFMIEGSSIAPEVVAKVYEIAKGKERVLVFLDSNHTHDHVLSELNAYACLVTLGSYCVVYDTVIEDTSEECLPDRPWGKGDNPKTAVLEYLVEHPELEIDRFIEDKLMITVAPSGYLKRVG